MLQFDGLLTRIEVIEKLRVKSTFLPETFCQASDYSLDIRYHVMMSEIVHYGLCRLTNSLLTLSDAVDLREIETFDLIEDLNEPDNDNLV